MTAGLSSEQTSTDQHLCKTFKTTDDDCCRGGILLKIKNNYLLKKIRKKGKWSSIHTSQLSLT